MKVFVRSAKASGQTDFRTGHGEVQIRVRLLAADTDRLDMALLVESVERDLKGYVENVLQNQIGAEVEWLSPDQPWSVA